MVNEISKDVNEVVTVTGYKCCDLVKLILEEKDSMDVQPFSWYTDKEDLENLINILEEIRDNLF